MQVTFFKYLISTSLPIFKKNEKIIINTINPHSFYVAENDKIFKNALLESNFLVPDGLGVVLVLKFFKKIKIQRITGWDIHQFYLQYANAKCLKVFYMGSSEETLFYIEKKINKNLSKYNCANF